VRFITLLSPKRRLAAFTITALLLSILVSAPVVAQPLVWVSQGPGPLTGGQVEKIRDLEVVGAINAVAPHPTDPKILYVGAVNGGIWKTTNGPIGPTWQNLTDFHASLSIGALEFDPTDPASETLVAGIGESSSFGAGGALTGLLRTNNGGASWISLDGGGVLSRRNITGVAPRGGTIVVSTTNGGIFRSTNTGATFAQISGGTGTGLPLGGSFDLAGDPIDPTRLYTHAGGQGLFRSADTGATWTRVSTAAMDALIAVAGNLEIAVGRSNNVYVAIVTGSQLAGVFRSGDGGNAWTAMDLPTTIETAGTFGIHPGFQGNTHLSLAADLLDANVVYIGGDRQPTLVPNSSIGAQDFTGRLFRGDASKPAGMQFVPLTHRQSLPLPGGTFSGSAPHADSRDMDINGLGDLLEGDDGGIYRRTEPRNNRGDWFSMNGNLRTTELHAVAWDTKSNVIVGGAQDTGTPEQSLVSFAWRSLATADGGVVAVDDIELPPPAIPLSFRYSSNQNLGAFRRRSYLDNNSFFGEVFPALAVLGGGAPLMPQFYTPIETNTVAPRRLIIGANSVYESLDRGDTITEIGPGIQVNDGDRNPIAYGAQGNPDMLYVGSGARVLVRSAANPAPLVASATYPGDEVVDIAINQGDAQNAFVIDEDEVFLTTDAGATWTNLTGNLPSLGPGNLRSLAFRNRTGDGALLVGGDTSVFMARGCGGFAAWSRLGTGLPTVPVYELDYDTADDLLLAGTLGRGAWTLKFVATPGTPSTARIQVPGGVGLGASCVGGTTRGILNVCNTGKEDLLVDPIGSTHPRLTVTPPSSGYPVTIGPAFCFPFETTFSPAGSGPATATFAIPSNDPNRGCTTTAALGAGTEPPDVRVTGSTDFGTVAPSTLPQRTLTVCNIGGCGLSVTAATLSCTDFSLINNSFPAALGPGVCLDLVVRFTPRVPGTKLCDLRIASNDPDSPVVVRALTGTTP
jgi:photosystem II stability/assembly factor-like uncharacterized protein